jgi:hypothetical protein
MRKISSAINVHNEFLLFTCENDNKLTKIDLTEYYQLLLNFDKNMSIFSEECLFNKSVKLKFKLKPCKFLKLKIDNLSLNFTKFAS